ncbi:MAG: primosomal protein N' [Natronospirillum sp.]
MLPDFSQSTSQEADKPDSTYAVAVFTPLHQSFSYTGPANLRPGTRVRVPFGHRDSTGVVLGLAQDTQGIQLKAISTTPDGEPLLPPDLVHLGQWLSDYYHAPIGACFELLLPALARSGDELPAPKPRQQLALTANGRAVSIDQLRGTKRQTLISTLQQQGSLPTTELKSLGVTLSTARSLERDDLLMVETVATPLPPKPSSSTLTLSPAQQHLLDALLQLPVEAPPQLLLGATGSGKTEIYIEWCRAVLAQGKQCLVLLPEIGLTPQMVSRFSARLGFNVAQLHSGMTDLARLRVWQGLRNGDITLVLGTRSAVLAPFADLGLVIVDEEHDGSYKQQDGVRYHARDVAIWRTRQLGCPILLGSATPSLESLANAARGRFARHDLARRAEQGEVARSLIDITRHATVAGLSAPLAERITAHLQQGQQVMLFLNRRGIAPSMICTACGTIQQCPNCSAYVTYHQKPARLLCHHCGWSHRPPYPCESCGSTTLEPLGVGTAGLEEQLREHWPDAALWRIDRDTIKNRDDWAALNSDVHSGKPGILLGTQMLAKGHDYPNVTLTAILDADSGLFSADFRAFERTAQLLTQVSGRAGRRSARAEVLVQTRLPEHPLLNQFLTQDYATIAEHLLRERQRADMPPFSFLATVRADHQKEEDAAQFLDDLIQQLGPVAPIMGIGPMPALMSKRAGQYRQLWLLRASSRPALHGLLHTIVRHLSSARVPAGIRWGIDVDPQDF